MALPRRAIAIAVAGILLLGLQGCSSSPVKAAAVSNDKDRAPDFALKDAAGKTVRLSDYRGKVVLLDFWETTCAPCRIEIPWFTEIERQNKDQGFAVLGVAMDEEGWEVVKPFLAEMKVNYRVVIGDEETARKYGGVDALPTTLLIDREGRIASVHVGLTNRKIFENGIQELLKVPAAHAALPPAAVRMPL